MFSGNYCACNKISSFYDLRGWWKHKLLRKKATSPMEKTLWPVFFPLIEDEIIWEQHFKGVHEVFWQFFCKRFHHFFGTLEVDRNKHFKNSCFHVIRWKKIWTNFSRNIEYDKCQEIFFTGHKLFWPLLWNLYEHSFRT